MAGVEISDVLEPERDVVGVSGIAGHGVEQEGDMVATVETLDDPRGDPSATVTNDGGAARSRLPRAAGELVDLVTGVLTEQSRKVDVAATEEMHDDHLGPSGHPKGVVALGDAYQEAGWLQAALRSEPDEAAGSLSVGGCRGDDEHGVVDGRYQGLQGGVGAVTGHGRSVPLVQGSAPRQ